MKTKKDIIAILTRFTSIASYDVDLQKYYLVFEDRKRGGIYTLMLKEEQWSIHGHGDDYCDDEELFLTEKETVDFLWNNRATFWKSLLVLKG